RPRSGELVEAGKRLGSPFGIEPFDAGMATVGSEDAQREELGLVRPAAGAVGTVKDRGYEERVRLQGEDIVEADGVVLDEIEPDAYVPQELLRSPRGPGAQSPVVDDLDGGFERLGIAIEVERPQRQRHRARDPRDADARGPVGQQLGVTLVEPDDGVTQVVRGEGLA